MQRVSAANWGIFGGAGVNFFLPITSFNGPLLGFKKSRSRGKMKKIRERKAKMRKKTKH